MSQFRHEMHDHDGDLAVFLIGMRVNQPWRPDLFLPVFAAMPRMVRELYVAKAAHERGQGPDLGFLHAHTLVGANGPTLVQYWKGVDHIYAYAADPQREHRPAWLAFYERSRNAAGAVGIWHETYAVAAGAAESLYVGMPRIGLGAAFGTTDVKRRKHAQHVRVERAAS